MNYFKKQLGYIKNDEIRENTIKVLSRVHPDFYKDAASSTGKYHPDYALGEGGLYRHTKAAANIAHDLLQLEQNKQLFPDDNADYIIAAIILHDCCKHGVNWDNKYTVHRHPTDAANLVLGVIGNCIDYGNIVSDLIASHMGQWNVTSKDKTILPKPETPAQQFVHMCDYLASRKYLEYKFDEEDLKDE